MADSPAGRFVAECVRILRGALDAVGLLVRLSTQWYVCYLAILVITFFEFNVGFCLGIGGREYRTVPGHEWTLVFVIIALPPIAWFSGAEARKLLADRQEVAKSVKESLKDIWVLFRGSDDETRDTFEGVTKDFLRSQAMHLRALGDADTSTKRLVAAAALFVLVLSLNVYTIGTTQRIGNAYAICQACDVDRDRFDKWVNAGAAWESLGNQKTSFAELLCSKLEDACDCCTAVARLFPPQQP